MDTNRVGENIRSALAELQKVLDGKLDCMKIGIEFERVEKGSTLKGNEWPCMPIY